MLRWAGQEAGGDWAVALPVLALIVMLIGPVLAVFGAKRVADRRGVGLDAAAVATVLITGLVTAGLLWSALRGQSLTSRAEPGGYDQGLPEQPAGQDEAVRVVVERQVADPARDRRRGPCAAPGAQYAGKRSVRPTSRSTTCSGPSSVSRQRRPSRTAIRSSAA